MSKSILLSVRPEWVEKILNGKKTIEVRKQFPKDYKGWVYIYCTKGEPYLYYNWNTDTYSTTTLKDLKNGWSRVCSPNNRLRAYQNGTVLTNGRVVARFWCDYVDILNYVNNDYSCLTPQHYDICKESCLEPNEIYSYLNKKTGYAIHISEIEIFDEPRELSEFDRPCKHWDNEHQCYSSNLVCYAESCKFYKNTKLTKAPQNYCYVEGD